MTEEIKENEKQCNCCLSPEYKQFLATILASFLGCLVALCLYSAATRPQLPPCNCSGPCPVKMHKFHKGFPEQQFKKENFHKHRIAPDKMNKEHKPPIDNKKD